jgi:beta-propeller repeat-containing protein/HYDIN/CFA65/VesB family protein/ASPM-SPD-2-Hydin domain-containing protein
MRFGQFTPAYRRICTVGLIVACCVFGLAWIIRTHASPAYSNAHAARPTPSTASNAPTQVSLAEAYRKLSLSFEPNRGQADHNVKFLTRGRGYALFLTATEAVLSYSEPSLCAPGSASHGAQHSLPSNRGSGASGRATVRVDIKLVGANPSPEISGLERLPGTTNYLIGSDPSHWHVKIPTYAQLRYKNIYPGIDLVYYGNQGQLESDFVVAPGADPNVIRISLEGGGALRLDAQGDLVLGATDKEIRLHKPRLYQEVRGKKQEVFGKYFLAGSNQVGFEVGSYNTTQELTIDPTLSYSTYLGGTTFDQANGIAVDAAGNAYVAGFTSSSNFITTPGAFDTSAASGFDAFVTKFSPTGSVVYSTYLGGNGPDQAAAIAVDPAGAAYIAGETYSTNFPIVTGAFTTNRGQGDAFVAKLSGDGSSLLYSTYLGGSAQDAARGIAVDSSGNAYVAGQTFSTDFPMQSALQPTNSGNEEAFVTELNASGSLVYSTYFGGSGFDQANGIAVDPSGNAYVTGYTNSSDFRLVNPLQGTCKSCPNINDGFVAEIGAGGSALVYSTFLGGSGDDQGMGIAVDTLGSAYVTGFTFSNDFPATAGAYQQSLLGTASAFVTKINPNGSSLGYSTYLGSDICSYGQAIGVISGTVYVAGVTSATGFPLVNPIQSKSGGNPDVFLAQLNTTGSALNFSTYLGGSAYDEANALAVDGSGNAYIAGRTTSTDFPMSNASQRTYGGGNSDAFIAKIFFSATATVMPSSLKFPNQTVGTTSQSQTVTVSNTGAAPLTVTSVAVTGTNGADFAAASNCNAPVAPSANCTISVTFTPTGSGNRSGTLSIADNTSGSPQTVSLTGKGTLSTVTLSPTSVLLGSQQVGTTSPAQTVTLSNAGPGPVTITNIAITGTNAGDFNQSNGCPMSPSTLGVGANCSINVTFTPTASGNRSATLSVSDNASGSPQKANLSGTGTAPVVSLSSTSLSFGRQPVGTTSAAKTVKLTNKGTAPLTIASITVGGTNAGDFLESNTCPLGPSTLAIGASCTISVTFAPSATGTRTAAVTITDNASNSPQKISLTGSGI